VDYVKILSDGSCVWYREFELTATHCPMDITWFPFDVQECPLTYESKRYESGEMNVSSKQLVEAVRHYQTNGEWNLIGIVFVVYCKPVNYILCPPHHYCHVGGNRSVADMVRLNRLFEQSRFL